MKTQHIYTPYTYTHTHIHTHPKITTGEDAGTRGKTPPEQTFIYNSWESI